MPLALSKPTPCEDGSPPFTPCTKLGVLEVALLWQLLDEDPRCPSRVVLDKMAQRQTGVALSVRHLNRLRVQWKRNRPKGRPRRLVGRPAGREHASLVQLTPHLSCVGVHLFARWLDQQASLTPLVAGLQQAIDAYKRAHHGEDFALLHHRERTLRRRLQALVLAPLLGIKQVSAFD